jgi:hypothetical protein
MAQPRARPSIPFRRHSDFARERLIRRRSRAQAPPHRIGVCEKLHRNQTMAAERWAREQFHRQWRELADQLDGNKR